MKNKEARELINNAPEAAEEQIPEEELNMDYIDDPVEKEPVIKRIWNKAKPVAKKIGALAGETTIIIGTAAVLFKIADHFLPGAGDAIQDAAEGSAEAAKDAVADGSLTEKVEELLDK